MNNEILLGSTMPSRILFENTESDLHLAGAPTLQTFTRESQSYHRARQAGLHVSVYV